LTLVPVKLAPLRERRAGTQEWLAAMPHHMVPLRGKFCARSRIGASLRDAFPGRD